MRKLTLSAFFILLTCSIVFATTAQYRISSGEVYGISTINQVYENGQFLASTNSATYPDGTICLDPNGDLKVFGYAKIYDNGVIRNATQNEIDTFAAANIEDANIFNAEKALSHFESNIKFRMAIMAVIRGIVREDNENKQFDRDLLDVIATSTSLGDFQSRAAALDRPVDREVADAKTYILNQINKDD